MPELRGDLLRQVGAVLRQARVGIGDLEHDAGMALQQRGEGLLAIVVSVMVAMVSMASPVRPSHPSTP